MAVPCGRTAERLAWQLRERVRTPPAGTAPGADKAQLLEFLDSAPLGFFSADEEGRFRLANQTFAAWLGYSADELVRDLHISDVVGEGAYALVPVAGQDRHRVVEVELRPRDGRVVPAEVAFAV